MNDLNELAERMDGVDEIVDTIIKKIDAIEKREIKTTDYTLHFEALQKIFELFLIRYNKESGEIRVAINQVNVSYPAEQIQQALTDEKAILEAIQKALPVKVKHQLDFKTKGWIIAGIILLIVTAISTGLSGHLWIENNRLQSLDIKYRLVRQVDSISTKWADSVYTGNPDKAEETVNKLESGQIKLTESKMQKRSTVRRLSKQRVKD